MENLILEWAVSFSVFANIERVIYNYCIFEFLIFFLTLAKNSLF